MPISKDQFDLMAWLDLQPEPMSIPAMEDIDAPGFTAERVNRMHKDGLLDSRYVGYNGQMLPGYSVSDKGHAALENLRAKEKAHADRQRKERRDTRRYWITTGIAIAALIKAFLPELTLVATWLWKLLGL